MATVSIRRYDPRDAEPVWRLHELAFSDLRTDPDDIPGTDDLRDVEGAYLDAGGEFLVGVLPASVASADAPRTHDGALVAMGGFLPSEAGHDDERTVEGAAELHRMRVAPAHQGAGHGRAILRALEEGIREAGLTPALATTAKRQERAVAFYTAAGYTPVGESTEGDYELVHFEKDVD